MSHQLISMGGASHDSRKRLGLELPGCEGYGLSDSTLQAFSKPGELRLRADQSFAEQVVWFLA